MALRQVRIGPMDNIVQYDDGEFSAAIETDQPIKSGTPVAADDVLRLGDVGVGVGDVIGPAASTDHAITRFNGATGKIVQDSLVTISDTGSVSLPAGQTVDGVDVSVHAANVDAHHAQSHNAASHSDIASSGANIDDAVTKRHTQGTDTSVGALTIYANNAAAIVGGLGVNDLYRTGGDPDLVCVVH